MYTTIVLIGRLGADPELSETPGGAPVCKFNLATNRTWTQDGARMEEATWWRVVVFGRMGEMCAKSLSKGDMVLVDHQSVRATAYVDRGGELRANLEVVAKNIKFLYTKKHTNGEIPF